MTREAMYADLRAAEERVVKVRSEAEQVVEKQKKDRLKHGVETETLQRASVECE